jgi:hypothetical protein
MQSNRIIAAAAALALAAAPAALAKKPDSPGAQGKAKAEQKGQNGKAKGKGKAKNIVVHGTIAEIKPDGSVTINVAKANKHGRTGLPTFTFTPTKFSVADVDPADGGMTLADFQPGDSVVAHSKGAKLISVTNPEPEETEATEPAGETPAPVTPTV